MPICGLRFSVSIVDLLVPNLDPRISLLAHKRPNIAATGDLNPLKPTPILRTILLKWPRIELKINILGLGVFG